MNNNGKYFSYVILSGIYTMMLTGSVLQTFMLESGYSEEITNIFFSVMNMIQVISILVLTGAASKLKNTKLWIRNMYFLAFPFAVTLVVMCFAHPQSNSFIFVLLYLFGTLYNIGVGVGGVLSYKLPYIIMDMNDYGRLMSLAGSISGAVCFLLSLLLSFLQGSLDYFSVMRWSYIISTVMIVACTFVIGSFCERKFEEKPTESAVKTNILKYKPFTYLIIPNITRGFCLGIVSMAVTIGYYHECINSFSASIIVIIANATTIIGCLAYSKMLGYIKNRKILLFSSIAVALFMPLMVLRGKTVDFLVFYTLVNFFITIINYAVPVTVTKIADYSIIGQYSAGRMLLNTLGTSIAGFVCVAMFKLIGVVATVTVAGILQLLSGSGYYLYLKYCVKLKGESSI